LPQVVFPVSFMLFGLIFGTFTSAVAKSIYSAKSNLAFFSGCLCDVLVNLNFFLTF